MADPTTDLVIVILVATLTVVTILELRYLKARRGRGSKGEELLPDRAHNALVTTRAIADSLVRRGLENPQTSLLVDEAEVAIQRGNYRVGMEVLDRARTLLLREQGKAGREGTLTSGPSAADLPAPKEGMPRGEQGEMVRARFALRRAEQALEAAGGGGRVGALVQEAQRNMEGGDYEACLRVSHQALKALGMGEAIAPAPGARPVERCLRCGSELPAGKGECPACGEPRGSRGQHPG